MGRTLIGLVLMTMLIAACGVPRVQPTAGGDKLQTPQSIDDTLQADLPEFPGTIVEFAGLDTPQVRKLLFEKNWLFADGCPLSRFEFPLLYLWIGEAFGSSTSDRFRLPDLRGRTPVGVGTVGEERRVNRGDRIGDPLVRQIGSRMPLRMLNNRGGGSSWGASVYEPPPSRVRPVDRGTFDNWHPSLAVNFLIYSGPKTITWEQYPCKAN